MTLAPPAPGTDPAHEGAPVSSAPRTATPTTPRRTRSAARTAPIEPLPIPTPRGPVSAALVAVLTGRVGAPPIVSSFDAQVERAIISSPDILTDDDLQLALLCFGALDAGGLGRVDARWAADPLLLAVCENLETALEEALRQEVPLPTARAARGAIATGEDVADAVATALDVIIDDAESSRPHRYLAGESTAPQLREHLVARSIRSVLVDADQRVVADDATAAAVLLARLGDQRLQTERGRYLDVVDVRVLTAVNTTAMLARHDRLRGLFYGLRTTTGSIETSIESAVIEALGRLGRPLLQSDAARGAGAGRARIAGGLVEAQPELLDDVLLGAAIGVAVERWITEHEVVRWTVGRSALRECDALRNDAVLRADRAAEIPPVDDRPITLPVERTGGIRR
ncbi:hypothetical protein OVN18_04160 [Microcella daejeonensis]|uniref:Uncharacterized protein n=1 Tax=Microcella daejeonensis TaxID=2994971 RepID=A0A9E8MM75_9MICO|nr:hypothetical protein [Microcella daejeonensis]WAB82210.1 hypothetical protein OVN18_04160 [Microcella daejeonensis]